MSIRILMAVPAYYPAVEYGGPVFKIQAIADRLHERGHSVHVVSPSLANGARKRGRETTEDELNGVHVTYLPSLLRYHWLTLSPGIFAFCRGRLGDFDAVHAYGFYDLLTPTVAYFARRRGIPYVIETLGMYVPKFRSLVKKRAYHALLGNRLVANAARIIATSPREKDELIEAGIDARKLVLRRNGIAIDAFQALPEPGEFRRKFGIESDSRIILYLGRLDPQKGADLLLEAFAGLDLPRTRLVIAGPKEHEGYYEELRRTARASLHDSVLFPGGLYGRDKMEAFVDADLVVLPSRSESFGNVVAEAIASGTPVVITDQCGIAPYVRERAGLVVSCEFGEIRRAIARMLNDPALYERFRANCSTVAAELSWDEPIAQMEAIYSQVIAESQAARS